VITILFWNLAKRPVALAHLACLGRTHSVDVFLLAECPADLGPTIVSLNALNQGAFREEFKERPKVRAITRLKSAEFVHRLTIPGMAVWSILAPSLSPPEILLAGIHLPSKFGGASDTDQFSIAKEVAEELSRFEDRRRHRNTIVVGDFNMQPYDQGMTSVGALHGVMTKKLARLPDRIHRERPRPCFYNPMWGFFGDISPGPAGSYFWDSSQLHNTHWT
jgi:hypothetical protein